MDTEIQLGGPKHGETHNKKPCLLDNTLSSSAVNTLLVSCHETSSINRQGQVTVACQTRVGCARAQWKLHDPQMQTLCLTIIIPFLSPLVSGLIISAAAVTERFIDNSSGACVCVCACPIVRRCVRTCGIRQQYQLQPLVHFSPSSLNHHLHLLLRATFFFSFLFFPLSFCHVSCPSTYWALQTPVSEV